MASERPNILLIMTDQQRGDCLSSAGHPVLLTPNMDTIAEAGVRFTQAYSSCPSCIAARRSLLSGQFPRTHGQVGYRDGVAWNAPATLPGVLTRAGYQTALVGRGMHQHPPRARFGYEQMTVHAVSGASDYESWFNQRAPDAGGSMGFGITNNDWTARPWALADELHFTHWTVNQALEFLQRRDPTCPFFLTVSFLAPHPPLQPPAFYFERYLRQEVPAPWIGDWATPTGSDLGGNDLVAPSRVNLQGEALRSCRAAYYGLINQIDDEMRRLLNPINGVQVQTRGNTVVLFTSDHGEMLGDHYIWRKSVPYESSAHIPLLLSAPARYGLPRGGVVDGVCCLEDVMPTLLDLAGIEVPASVEGRSLLPLARGESAAWREYVTIEHSPLHQSLADGREKFIWWVADGHEQFFDLAADPHEMHDLASSPAAASRIAMWRERLVRELVGRPEGFSDGERLISGRPFPPVLSE
ncbi:MAG: arylsulfatase [Anaerolineae bacterium]